MIIEFQNCNGEYGCRPSALTFHSKGALYAASGPIIRMTPPTRKHRHWTLGLIYKFKGSPDGYDPIGITFGTASTIFGTTIYGGTGTNCQGGCGTVFEVSP